MGFKQIITSSAESNGDNTTSTISKIHIIDILTTAMDMTTGKALHSNRANSFIGGTNVGQQANTRVIFTYFFKGLKKMGN